MREADISMSEHERLNAYLGAFADNVAATFHCQPLARMDVTGSSTLSPKRLMTRSAFCRSSLIDC